MTTSPILITSKEEFTNSLDQCSRDHLVLLIDFHADWCRPCQQLGPYFDSLCEEYANRGVLFARLNVDQCQEVSSEEFVSKLPTFRFYRNHECIATLLGSTVNRLKPLLDKFAWQSSIMRIRECRVTELKLECSKLLVSMLDDALSPSNDDGVDRIFSIEPKDLDRMRTGVAGFTDCLTELGFQIAEPADRRTGDRVAGARAQLVLTDSDRRMYHRLIQYRSTVASYLDPEAQALANSLIPTENLLAQAAEKSGCPPKEVTQRAFLTQLLAWFKEFFQWAGEFHCEKCETKMQSYGQCNPSLDEIEGDAHLVELYSCPADQTHPRRRFPRFNNPKRLLQTRLGRCGEWANCLTLCLVSVRRSSDDPNRDMPWFPSCRFVVDWTDHVWCELWLEDDGPSGSGTYRWVHCDPGGDVNKPLLYESGWGKKLTYIFAYTVPPASVDWDSPFVQQAVDVQDVTWRYTRNVNELIPRRTLTPESHLAQLLTRFHMDAARVWSTSATPTDNTPYSLERIVRELASFLLPPSESTERLPGRQTGPLEWRRARGELGDDDPEKQPEWHGKQLVLHPTETELLQGQFYMRYSSALDIYERPFALTTSTTSSTSSDVARQDSKKPLEEAANQSKGWRSLAHRWRNIERKVEHDWHMVYLCRDEGSPPELEGQIEWDLQLDSDDYEIGKVSLFANQSSHSDETNAQFVLCSQTSSPTGCITNESKSPPPPNADVCVPLTAGSSPLFDLNDFCGSKRIHLQARLWNKSAPSESDRPLAWQKAQLFRQKTNDTATWSLEWKVQLVRRPSTEPSSDQADK